MKISTLKSEVMTKDISCLLFNNREIDHHVISQFESTINFSLKITDEMRWEELSTLNKGKIIGQGLIVTLRKLFHDTDLKVSLMRPQLAGNKQNIFTGLYDISVSRKGDNFKQTLHTSVTFKH